MQTGTPDASLAEGARSLFRSHKIRSAAIPPHEPREGARPGRSYSAPKCIERVNGGGTRATEAAPRDGETLLVSETRAALFNVGFLLGKTSTIEWRDSRRDAPPRGIVVLLTGKGDFD